MSTSLIRDYNSRLKPYGDKGLCGDPEYLESSLDLTQKVDTLARFIRQSRYCVVFTGAGISTSCGIPDFRGPRGIWTRELQGEVIPEEEKTSRIFDQAKPSVTHHAISQLLQLGFIKHVISQNVDGLHLRSGVPQDQLSELHGNIFMEICDRCKTRYLRDQDVGGMGMKLTGNKCDDDNCRGKLRDFAVDWDTDLPEDIFAQAHQHLNKADLVICLGTSLRIRPAGNMPLLVLKKNRERDEPGKIVVVNLQKTHVDREASLKIHYYCDEVMRRLGADFGLQMDEDNISTTDSIVSSEVTIAEYFHEDDDDHNVDKETEEIASVKRARKH